MLANLVKKEIDSHIPFGLKDGKMLAPSQVDNGVACDCVCAECGEPLVAKANIVSIAYKVKPHFAHLKPRLCKYAMETAVHLAAKQLIEQRLGLFLPDRIVEVSKTDELEVTHFRRSTIHAAGLMSFASVRVEKYIPSKNVQHKMKPDLVATTNDGTEFIIEISVTNPVDEIKKRKIQELGMPAIQVDLSRLISFDFDVLAKSLFEPFEWTSWLFHPDDENTRNTLLESLEPTLERARKNKEKQRFNDAKQLRARKAEQESREQRSLQNKRDEEERAKRFKSYTSERKLEKLVKYLNVEELMTPWFLNIKVNGESSFLDNRKVWQLAIFVKFIHQSICDKFNQKQVLEWVDLAFNIVEKFPNSKEVAVWNFLDNLCHVGAIKHTGKQQFEIVERSLDKLIAKNLRPPLNRSEANLEDFKWVCDSNWPNVKYTTLIAKKYQDRYGVLDWENIATLFPTARKKAIGEFVTFYSQGHTKLNSVVIGFFYEAGFIIKR